MNNSNCICVESKAITSTQFYGRFILGRFASGQGLTVANTLRRSLLTELSASFIALVYFPGAKHEYAGVPGLKECVLDVLMNLQQIRLRSDYHAHPPIVVDLHVLGPAQVRARDLDLPDFLTCVNPEQPIATVNETGSLVLRLVVCCDRGARPTIPYARHGRNHQGLIRLLHDDARRTQAQHTVRKRVPKVRRATHEVGRMGVVGWHRKRSGKASGVVGYVQCYRRDLVKHFWGKMTRTPAYAAQRPRWALRWERHVRRQARASPPVWTFVVSVKASPRRLTYVEIMQIIRQLARRRNRKVTRQLVRRWASTLRGRYIWRRYTYRTRFGSAASAVRSQAQQTTARSSLRRAMLEYQAMFLARLKIFETVRYDKLERKSIRNSRHTYGRVRFGRIDGRSGEASTGVSPNVVTSSRHAYGRVVLPLTYRRRLSEFEVRSHAEFFRGWSEFIQDHPTGSRKRPRARRYRTNKFELPRGCFSLSQDVGPVTRVNYNVEATGAHSEQVGLEVWTNGTVDPRVALTRCVRSTMQLFSKLQGPAPPHSSPRRRWLRRLRSVRGALQLNTVTQATLTTPALLATGRTWPMRRIQLDALRAYSQFNRGARTQVSYLKQVYDRRRERDRVGEKVRRRGQRSVTIRRRSVLRDTKKKLHERRETIRREIQRGVPWKTLLAHASVKDKRDKKRKRALAILSPEWLERRVRAKLAEPWTWSFVERIRQLPVMAPVTDDCVLERQGRPMARRLLSTWRRLPQYYPPAWSRRAGDLNDLNLSSGSMRALKRAKLTRVEHLLMPDHQLQQRTGLTGQQIKSLNVALTHYVWIHLTREKRQPSALWIRSQRDLLAPLHRFRARGRHRAARASSSRVGRGLRRRVPKRRSRRGYLNKLRQLLTPSRTRGADTRG